VTQPVILDCDNALGLAGRDVDDALALLFLLRQPSVALRGVTTCFGNAPLDGVLRATRHLLMLLGRPDLPVLPGAARPGQEATAAARYLVEATAAEPGRVTILAIGPASNLAAAAALDPGFFARCASIICLGGSLGPARLGWRRLRELNFEADPDSARALLAQRHCPLTVVPATSCVELRLSAADLPALHPALRGGIRRWLLLCRLGRGIRTMVAWDMVGALALTHPGLLCSTAATVTLRGRGLVEAAAGDAHRIVQGVAEVEAARRIMLSGLAPGA
jgi:inosine-uridine nucleoside N-ribohydrolase